MRTAIGTIVIVLLALAHDTQAAPERLRVGLLISATGPASILTKEVADQLREARESGKLRSEMTLIFYDTEVYNYKVIEQTALKDRVNVLIGPVAAPIPPPIYMKLIRSMKGHPSTLFIYPYFSEELYDVYKREKPDNSFLIPKKVIDIIFVIDDLAKERKYEIGEMKKTLEFLQWESIRMFQEYQSAIKKKLKTAIMEWQKKRGVKLLPKAAAYLSESISQGTLEYALFAPKFVMNKEKIGELVSKEIKDILDVYVKKTGFKEVTLADLKSSGVNGCKSPPCKLRCCSYYKLHNHDCLQKIDCD